MVNKEPTRKNNLENRTGAIIYNMIKLLQFSMTQWSLDAFVTGFTLKNQIRTQGVVLWQHKVSHQLVDSNTNTVFLSQMWQNIYAIVVKNELDACFIPLSITQMLLDWAQSTETSQKWGQQVVE